MKKFTTFIKTVVMAGVLSVSVSMGVSAADASSYTTELFGPNVYVFDDEDSAADINKVATDVYNTQHTNQFGKDRYAIFFKEGQYSNDVKVNVGFYTQVAGLGLKPTDTSIGGLEAAADWMVSYLANGDANFNATCNFWRSAENLTVNSDCLWAVSQGTSFRRMNINGKLAIQHWGGWASGGFMADTAVKGTVEAWSQQQWITRNSSCGNWDGGVWNMNFVGMEDGSAPAGTWPYTVNTTVEKTPIIKEKPFLAYNDEDGYYVFVPKYATNTKGVSWKDEVAGEKISIDKFYIAKPGDSAAKINAQLADGKSLILTPGIYELSEAIKVTQENTIVMGLGYATIKPTKGNSCIETADVGGVVVCDILFDAGHANSNTLLKIGEKKTSVSHKTNPILIADIYFRVGGADTVACKTNSCIIVNANDVIGDNFWVWRADHGVETGWTKNVAKNGIIVNGDNVTAYGLMVEHFEEYQTVWNGNNGSTYMYQCEIPYDVPSQSAWMSKEGNGYAGYYVAPTVTSHKGFGLGVYSNFTACQAFLGSAVVVPKKENVVITNACSVVLSGRGGIEHVVNTSGDAIFSSGDVSRLISYKNGTAVTESSLTNKDMRKNIVGATVSGVPTSEITYTGKYIKPSLKLNFRGLQLRNGIDYTVAYKNNKNAGVATIVITGKGMFRGTKNCYFNIAPVKPKMTAKGGKNCIKFSIKKTAGASKYEILISKSKKFTKAKLVTVKAKKKTVKKTVKKLISGNLYVKVRAYKVVGNEKIYGKYSKAIKVKVKK